MTDRELLESVLERVKLLNDRIKLLDDRVKLLSSSAADISEGYREMQKAEHEWLTGTLKADREHLLGRLNILQDLIVKLAEPAPSSPRVIEATLEILSGVRR